MNDVGMQHPNIYSDAASNAKKKKKDSLALIIDFHEFFFFFCVVYVVGMLLKDSWRGGVCLCTSLFSFYFCWRSNIFCRIPIIYRSWKLWRHHENLKLMSTCFQLVCNSWAIMAHGWSRTRSLISQRGQQTDKGTDCITFQVTFQPRWRVSSFDILIIG